MCELGGVYYPIQYYVYKYIMYINIYNIYIDWGSYGIIFFNAGNPNQNQPIGRWRVWTPLGCSWWFIRQSTSLTCWRFMAVVNEMCYQETSMFTICMACFRWIWFIVCWWSLAANDLPRSWASDSDLGVFFYPFILLVGTLKPECSCPGILHISGILHNDLTVTSL